MTINGMLSSSKCDSLLRFLSLLAQIAIILLAVVLVVNMTARQYAHNQVETVRVELLELIQQDKKDADERFRLLKDELVTYQSTREGRAQLFADRIEQHKQERETAIDRLNRRIDNLNSKVNYWTGKVKQSEIEEKLRNQ